MGHWHFRLVALVLASSLTAQRSPFFATVVGPDGKPIADAEVTCVFTPNLMAVGDPDVVTSRSDARGRARCNLIDGKLYLAWAITSADGEGAQFVSAPVPLAAAGRVMELPASLRVTQRTIAIAGLEAWRQVGGVGLRWIPDASQSVHVDLPFPKLGDVPIPASPWTTGLLGVRDKDGEVMVAQTVAPGQSQAIELSAPRAVHAIVRDMKGTGLSGVRLEHVIGPIISWGVFGVGLRSNRHRIAGHTNVDGVADFHRTSPCPSGDQTRIRVRASTDHASR